MMIIYPLIIILTQITIIYSKLCSCNQLKLQSECENESYKSLCIWYSNQCKQLDCDDITDKSFCNVVFKQSIFSKLQRIENLFSNLSTIISSIQVCQWNQQNHFCRKANHCSQIQVAGVTDYLNCYLAGCIVDVQNLSCNQQSFSNCNEIKDPLICQKSFSEQGQCYYENGCFSRIKDEQCQMIQSEIHCNISTSCLWKGKQCMDRQCFNLKEEELCNKSEFLDQQCFWTGENCEEVSQNETCPRRKLISSCQRNPYCKWDGNNCRNLQCEDFNCQDGVMQSFRNDFNSIIFCKGEDHFCKTLNPLKLNQTTCFPGSHFNYRWDQTSCKSCVEKQNEGETGFLSYKQIEI